MAANRARAVGARLSPWLRASLACVLLAATACKGSGGETRPVERAVIDVPPPSDVDAGGAKLAASPTRPARPRAGSALEAEIADIMNGFTKTTRCDDFDYFPQGGYQNFWCHRPTELTEALLEARAGVPMFLSGPHGGGFNAKAKSDFGHYNPAFVTWLADQVAPRSRDVALVAATQGMYDAMMKPLATVFYLTRVKVEAQPACFTRERDMYKRLLAAKTLPMGYYERWFFFMNPEYCARAARGQMDETYYYRHGMDGGVDGNVVKSVLAFYIRRSIDGTLPDFVRALDEVIAAYQPDLVAKMVPGPRNP